jgi:hypothetical protein
LVYSSDNVRKRFRIKSDGSKEEWEQILKKEYTSYIGSNKEFEKHIFACAVRNGYGYYKETVLISDGAK